MLATEDEEPIALLVAELLEVDRRAQQLARDVAANPALRAKHARDAHVLEIRLSVIEGALATVAPSEVERLHATIGEALLDLRFVRKNGDVTSLRLGRYNARQRLEVSGWTGELEAISARAAAMTEDTRFAGKASDSTRRESFALLQRLDELEATMRVLSPSAYDEREESVSIARHRLNALVR